MLHSIVPADVVFFDNTRINRRHLRLYDGVTFEISNGCVDRIISTNPRDYLKYHHLLGTKLPVA